MIKPWFDVTEEDQDAIMKATTWNAADFGYFRGGGYSSRFLTDAEMPVTMIRLNLVKGLGPVLQIAEAGPSSFRLRCQTRSGNARTTPGRVHGLLRE